MSSAPETQGLAPEIERRIAVIAAASHEAMVGARSNAAAGGRNRELAEAGVAAAQRAADAVHDADRSSQEAVAAIMELTALLEDIGGIAQDIRTIAEQTNLLSLNAAIEAARAGEHGRGFAIVANEVKRLAANSKDAVTTIEDLVERIRGGSARTIAAVERGAELGAQNARTIDEARVAFTEIQESVAAVQTRAERVGETIELIAHEAAGLRSTSVNGAPT